MNCDYYDCTCPDVSVAWSNLRGTLVQRHHRRSPGIALQRGQRRTGERRQEIVSGRSRTAESRSPRPVAIADAQNIKSGDRKFDNSKTSSTRNGRTYGGR